MYKLVAIDLDGTLLNSYGVVEEDTKENLKMAKEKGVEIVIASGRPISSIKAIAKEIGCNNYFIAGNGSVIYDVKKDEIIYKKYLTREKVLEIIKLCEENSISYNLYTEKTILAKSLKYNVLYYHKENLRKEESKKTNIRIVENMYEYIKNMEEDNFLKFTICDNTQVVFQSIIKKLREIEGVQVLDVSHMSRKLIKQGTEEVPIEYYYTEISNEEVDKWYALKNLISQIGIKPEEVMTIGDNINDKMMIKEAGMGISMKGSEPSVSEISDYVTDGNNQNGVGKAIEKFIIDTKEKQLIKS